MKNVIMIVDDQIYMVEVIREILEVEGFDKLMSFSDPSIVLEMIRKGLNPDIIITDYNMPEMTGIELITAARKIDPGIQVILTSGDDVNQLRTMARDCIVLNKQDPMFFSEIRATVRELIK